MYLSETNIKQNDVGIKSRGIFQSLSREKMTELFMNEISYFNDVIKGKNDYNGEMLSTYEIKQIEEK